MPAGSITLTPVGSGAATGGISENGQFSIPEDRGVKAGVYRAAVEVCHPTGRMADSPEQSGEVVDVMEQAIPAKYNCRTELEIDVAADGDHQFDFDLH